MSKYCDLVSLYGGPGTIITDDFVCVPSSQLIGAFHKDISKLFGHFFPNLDKLGSHTRTTINRSLIELLKCGKVDCDGSLLRVPYPDLGEIVLTTKIREWRDLYVPVGSKVIMIKNPNNCKVDIRKKVFERIEEGTFEVVYTPTPFFFDVVITAPPLADYDVIYSKTLIDVTVTGSPNVLHLGGELVWVDRVLVPMIESENNSIPDEVIELKVVVPPDESDGIKSGGYNLPGRRESLSLLEEKRKKCKEKAKQKSFRPEWKWGKRKKKIKGKKKYVCDSKLGKYIRLGDYKVHARYGHQCKNMVVRPILFCLVIHALFGRKMKDKVYI